VSPHVSKHRQGRLELAIGWAVFVKRLRSRFSRARRDDSGQAVVESAIVIPLMTFLILGIVQLAMIQHARIMNEYAAFNAARAGIVWNADRFIMENAAIISLMPTNDGLIKEHDIGNPLQMLKRILQRALLYQVNRRLPQAVAMIKGGANSLIDKIPGGKVGDKVKDALKGQVDKVVGAARDAAEHAATSAIGKALGSSDDRMVRVDILNPSTGTVGPTMLGIPGIGGGNFGSTGQEIEFDDFSQRSATRLTIKVRYMYMMRIPFANWVIHSAWMAGQAGKQLYGAIWNPQQDAPGETGFRSVSPIKNNAPTGSGFGSVLEARDLTVSAELANHGVYMVPLNSSYSMRMQSNPYRKSVQLK
jgi:hypothetical protein